MRRVSAAARHLVEVAHGAVEAVPQIGRHRVHLAQQRRRAGVRAPHLPLLVLRERHRAQAEQLVDLQGVVERRLALGCELGVVVEDDRRGEHHRVVAAGTEHREEPVVRAGVGEWPRPLGRIGRREEASSVDAEQQVVGDQCAAQPGRPSRSAPGGRAGGRGRRAVVDPHRQHPDGVRRVGAFDVARDPEAKRLPDPDQAAAHAAVRVAQLLDLPPAFHLEHDLAVVALDGHVVLARYRLVEGGVRRVADVEAVHRVEAFAGPPFDGAVLELEEAHGDGEPAASVDEHLGAVGGGLGPVLGHDVGRHQHAPLEAHLVLHRLGAVGIEHVALVEHGVGQ